MVDYHIPFAKQRFYTLESGERMHLSSLTRKRLVRLFRSSGSLISSLDENELVDLQGVVARLVAEGPHDPDRPNGSFPSSYDWEGCPSYHEYCECLVQWIIEEAGDSTLLQVLLAILDPHVHLEVGRAQEWADEINKVLVHDGFKIEPDSMNCGLPVFALRAGGLRCIPIADEGLGPAEHISRALELYRDGMWDESFTACWKAFEKLFKLVEERGERNVQRIKGALTARFPENLAQPTQEIVQQLYRVRGSGSHATGERNPVVASQMTATLLLGFAQGIVGAITILEAEAISKAAAKPPS